MPRLIHIAVATGIVAAAAIVAALPPALAGAGATRASSAAPAPAIGPAWMFPVGDSLDMSCELNGEPVYRVNRNVTSSSAGSESHDGADLSNRRGGGRVRVAGEGIVTTVQNDPSDRYGCCVVIAHTVGDSLLYSVYAHLQRRSICVREGQLVAPGERLGRVGDTGRATHPHLHFEVRLAQAGDEPWQLATPIDPVAFVSARVGMQRSGSTWASPYMAWAERVGLVPDGVTSTHRVSGADWARMLELLTRASGPVVPAPPSERADSTFGWADVAFDVAQLRAIEELPAGCPTDTRLHRQLCAERLGDERPSRNPGRLAKRPGAPTTAEAVLLLADIVLREPSASEP